MKNRLFDTTITQPSTKMKCFVTKRAYIRAHRYFNDSQTGHILGLIKRLELFDDDDWDTDPEFADMDITPVRNRFWPVYILRDRHGPLISKRVEIVFGTIPKFKELIAVSIDPEWSKLSQADLHYMVDLFVDYYYKRNALENPKKIKIRWVGKRPIGN